MSLAMDRAKQAARDVRALGFKEHKRRAARDCAAYLLDHLNGADQSRDYRSKKQ